jgi:hypothetical protein
MDKRDYKLPAIVWLKMADYMHPWLQLELGGALRIGEKRVLSVADLPGARDAFTGYETEDEILEQKHNGISLSATWKNCLDAGLMTDAETMKQLYGMTREGMRLYLPLECPKRGLTKNGVLRPWTLDMNFSKAQAFAMQKVLRQAFWEAVEEHDAAYAKRMDGKRYPAVDMIEDFCRATGTPDLHVEAMRREWQRRAKR